MYRCIVVYHKRLFMLIVQYNYITSMGANCTNGVQYLTILYITGVILHVAKADIACPIETMYIV